MKSILFTVLEDKLLSREKKQTFRTNFIPTYEISEIVMLRFKYKNGTKKDLYPVKVTELYPKQIKTLTLQEAILDGFSTLKEFQEKIMELNQIKSENHWGFITRWNEYFGVIDSKWLWKLNKRCPQCGIFLENHDIKACETGLSYCSFKCATTHVNENYNEGEIECQE